MAGVILFVPFASNAKWQKNITERRAPPNHAVRSYFKLNTTKDYMVEDQTKKFKNLENSLPKS